MLNLFSTVQLEKANNLLNSLNEDLKEKEKYKPIAVFTEKRFDVYICGNNKREVLFNILDFEGKTPVGFSANWRTLRHIEQELELC